MFMMMKKILVFLTLAALVFSCSAGAETRVCAVSVGKGDAILVMTDGYTCLIDAGKAGAVGKIARAMKELGIDRLDAVFLTHVDHDHAGGLAWLAQSGIEVGAWYASDCYFEYKEKKHPMVKLGVSVTWLSAGDEIPAGKDATFSVLAPITENEDDEDDNSLVLMLDSPDGRVLFAGDMELSEEAELLASGKDLSCDILKVANHGDGDATGAQFAQAASAQIAIISTDSYEKPGTPDPAVVSRLESAGSAVYSTEGNSAILAKLVGGAATAESLAWKGAYDDSGISLSVNAEDDLMTLKSARGQDLPLKGWYLVSEKGGESFFFGDADVLPAGGALTVGTKSSPDGAYAVYWDDKHVISDHGDSVTLYDPDGNFAAYGD